MPQPIGVIFDMDGVLVDSYVPHLRSWRLLAEELGASITEEQFAATFGRTSRDIIRELFGIGGGRAAQRSDDRKEEIYRDLIRGAVPVMPGAMEAVARLHGAGLRLAVGSSGPPENVELVWQELRLERFFSARVTGADVLRGKPDPQVFEIAAARLGIPAGRCVVVEDAPAGIEAARRAGMKTVALAGSHPSPTLAAADKVIATLSEIEPDLIVRLVELLPTRAD